MSCSARWDRSGTSAWPSRHRRSCRPGTGPHNPRRLCRTGPRGTCRRSTRRRPGRRRCWNRWARRSPCSGRRDRRDRPGTGRRCCMRERRGACSDPPTPPASAGSAGCRDRCCVACRARTARGAATRVPPVRRARSADGCGGPSRHSAYRRAPWSSEIISTTLVSVSGGTATQDAPSAHFPLGGQALPPGTCRWPMGSTGARRPCGCWSRRRSSPRSSSEGGGPT